MSEYSTVDLLIETIDEDPGGPLTKEGVELVRKGWEHGQAAMHLETTTLRQQLEQAEARVAELEAREDAMCDLSYSNGAEQGYSWGQAGDEAALAQCVVSRAPAGVAELKRLRQQADEAERAGGES